MSTQSSVIKLDALPQEDQYISESLTQAAIRRLKHDKLTMLALAVLAILTLLAIFAPLIGTYILRVDYTRTNADETFLPMGAPGHLFGTDDLGRDHLIRLLYAGQVSLGIGFAAAFLSLVIGLVLGVITGYYGGIVDDFINWVITTLDSIPALFLLLIVAATLQPGPLTLIIVLGLLGWTGITRLVRGETFSLREREYIVSARAIGAPAWRIMFSHILPNLVSVVVVTLMINIGGLILIESGLSFLGLGVKPPTPSWGNMLTNAKDFFTKGTHLVIAPGLLIVITVLCLYIIGDGIRDAFDPTIVN